MSIECGECGRDLRGGHDPLCSRYKDSVNEVISQLKRERDEAVAAKEVAEKYCDAWEETARNVSAERVEVTCERDSLRAELKAAKAKNVELLLKWAAMSTEDQRKKLRESEVIPPEIWNMVLS